MQSERPAGGVAVRVEAMVGWQPIKTAPHDRYVLLFSPNAPDWDGNMEVGRWFGDETGGCWWSCGGPNGGLEISGPDAPGAGHHDGAFTHWMPLPEPPNAEVSGERSESAGPPGYTP